MDTFVVPTSDTEWPADGYFADPKDIEDVDGVLEGMSQQNSKRRSSNFYSK